MPYAVYSNNQLVAHGFPDRSSAKIFAERHGIPGYQLVTYRDAQYRGM